MAAVAYQGHARWSVAQAIATNPLNVAPAERDGYDPTAWASAPGAAARANGWPRADGQSNPGVR